MQERIYLKLCAAADSLAASTALAASTPSYSVCLRGRNSMAVSRREIEFGPAMISYRGGLLLEEIEYGPGMVAVRDDFLQEEVLLLQNRRTILLVAAVPIQPAESVWRPPAHLRWEGGLIPADLVWGMVWRNDRVPAVEPVWLYGQPLVAAYALDPILAGWDEEGRPILLEPEEGWEGLPSMLDGQAFRPPWADPPIPTRPARSTGELFA